MECLNPYSNGTMYLMLRKHVEMQISELCLNPYSNGTMYLIRVYKDFKDLATGLNPYSNGTMYLIYY